MRLAFVADEISSFIKNHDSTWAIMQAGFDLGHEIYYTHISDLSFIGEPCANCIRLDDEFFQHQKVSSSSLLEFPAQPRTQHLSLESFDKIFMRADPPVDQQYVHACQILTLCKKAQVLNNPRAILEHNEKLSIFNFPELILPTMVTTDLDEINIFMQAHGTVVVKPLDLMGGQGIFILNAQNFHQLETLSGRAIDKNTIKPLMIQKFLPEVKTNGDKRLIVINGKLEGALRRIPSGSDFRANIAAGGTYAKYEPNKRDKEICETLSDFLVQNDIILAGVDVIGDFLTEINITSPTCLQEINYCNGLQGSDKLEYRIFDKPN
jgi:glutathione synthase